MAEAELAVLIIVLLAGLVIGLLLPWASLLVNTGHPARAVAREAGPRPRPPRAREPGTGRAATGAMLAIVVTGLLLVGLLPGLAGELPPLDQVPGGSFVLAFAALLVAVGYALPTWLGVRH